MGLNLRKITGDFFGGLGRGVRDVFDANTAEDQRKRLAAGQARMYQDQQRQLNQQRIQQLQRQTQQIQNTVRNPIGAAYNVAKPTINNYFKPSADKVRARDIVRETGGLLGQAANAVTENTQRLVQTADAPLKSLEINAAYKRGEIGLDEARKRAQAEAAQGFIPLKQNNKGELFDKYSDPSKSLAQKTGEFTKDFAVAGAKTASEVAPFARGASNTYRGMKLAKAAVPILKEGSVYGALNAGVGVAENGFDPKRVATDYATGVGSEFLGYGAGKLLDRGGKALANQTPTGTYTKGPDGKLTGSTKKVKDPVQAEADRLAADAMAPHVAQLQKQVANNPTPANKLALQEALNAQQKLLNGDRLSVNETNALYEAGLKTPKVATDTGESFQMAPRTTTPDAPVEVPANDGGLKWTQKFSPDRIWRENVSQPAEQAVNRGIYKLQTSQNPVARGIGKVIHGLNNEAGLTPEALRARHAFSGQGQYGKLEGDITTKLGEALSPESKRNVYAALDPDQAAVLGIKKPKNLTPDEKVLYDQLDAVRKETTDRLLAAELITPEQAANKSYLKREYSIFMDDPGYQQGLADTKGFLKKRKANISDEVLDTAVTDPAYLAGKHQAEAEQALAVVDYSNKLVEMGYVSDKPLKGYSQLPNTKLYGNAAGKWVPQTFAEDFTGFQYTSAMMSAVNDVLNAYDSWGVRRAKKELLTIFNPAVRLGNQVSNRVVFSQFGGINPIQFNKEYMNAGKLISSNSQYYKEAVQQGLMGTDITMADFGKRLMETTGDESIARKGAQWAEKTYSGADDKAKLTAYKIWRDRGYSPEQAYSLTQRAFQDYRSVGFFYDLAAKTPIIGNAFVRFAGDAMRIAKNTAIDHPVRAAATIAMWANFVNIMSKLSGETPEDKKTREDRFGAPKIPFTNISLTVQTPVGEINLARFIPQYQLNDISNPLTRTLPIGESPINIKDGKPELNPQGLQDPLLGQFAQLAIDQDFRGKSIRDPQNSTDEQGRKRIVEPLSGKDQALNVARFLGTQNIPLGREADTVLSAATGNKDIYGKKRSLPQAIGRAAGIKVEQFGPEQAQKQRSKNAFLDDSKAIEQELKGKSKEVQDAYKRATGYYKLREEVPNEFEPGTTRNKKAPVYNFAEDKYRDYANKEVYDMLLKKKVKESQTNGSPLAPQFDKTLSDAFRRQLIQNKSIAPGDDVEADQRLYNSPEWDTYQKLQKAYEEKAKKYYPGGDFKDELVKHQPKDFPKKGAAKEAYDNAFAAYSAGKGPKPAFTDAVARDKDAYSEAKRQWTNEERKARGLDPISKETWDNVTFGFQSDEEKVYKELKYGKGFGGYGSGKARAASPDKYRISEKAKGKVAKAKFSKGKALVKVKTSSPKLAKAKTSTTRSKV